MEIGIILRKRCDVAQQEVRPFLLEGCFSRRSRWSRTCVVEREGSFVTRSCILRFLIPVVKEAKFESVFAMTEGEIVEPTVIAVKVPVGPESEQSRGIIKVQVRHAGYLRGERQRNRCNHIRRVFPCSESRRIAGYPAVRIVISSFADDGGPNRRRRANRKLFPRRISARCGNSRQGRSRK